MDAAEECPVEVIKFDTATDERPDEASPARESSAEQPAAQGTWSGHTP
jgi:hypothetical protein